MYIKLYNTSGTMHTVDIDAVVITVNYSIGMNTYAATSAPQPVTAYHDPVNEVLNVRMSFPGSGSAQIHITDMLGRECTGYPVSAAGDQVEISTAMLAPGVYNCVVESGNSMWSVKFVK